MASTIAFKRGGGEGSSDSDDQVNGSDIELSESGGVYTGNFAMPGQASTLVINTGTSGNNSSPDGLDKD